MLNTYYRDLSNDAKLLYSILQDRMELSRKNNWFNDEGEIYLIFTRNNARDILNISSKSTITKIFNELNEKELIYEERQGLNKPNIIYIGKIDYTKGINLDMSGKYKKCTSGSTDNGLQEVQESYSSNTDLSNTDIKTEEEDAIIPDKIKSYYQQIFNRELTLEFFNKITSIYSDIHIILKVLEIAEEQADKPKFILVTLRDWANNGLTSISSINTYLENRQAEKGNMKANNNVNKPKKKLEELYANGYQ